MATNILQTVSSTQNQAVVNAVASELNSKTNTTSKSDESGGGDFLSMILTQLNKNGEIGDESLDTVSLITDDVELLDGAEDLLLEEATFVQILQVLEKLSGGGELKTLPKLTDKLDSLFKDATVLEEFKDAKSLKDILSLSKKYGLGLEDIKITSQDIQKLEKTFPNLSDNGFFKQAKTQISSEQILKSSAKKSETKEETSTLSNLLKDIKKSGDISKKVQTTVSDDTKKTVLSTIATQNATEDKIQTKQTNANTNNTELNSEKIVSKDEKQSGSEDTNKNNHNQSNLAKSVSKADNLNVKSSTLKQTLNTFAQEFKEKVQEYKPPVMKVQMSLNPKSLGEMEVTLINRGNNLHVSITSNTTAMNLFLQNQAEFKSSLVNMGFTNLEMNFSDQRQAQDGKQSGSKFASSYKQSDESEEMATENTILEIVLPDYV